MNFKSNYILQPLNPFRETLNHSKQPLNINFVRDFSILIKPKINAFHINLDKILTRSSTVSVIRNQSSEETLPLQAKVCKFHLKQVIILKGRYIFHQNQILLKQKHTDKIRFPHSMLQKVAEKFKIQSDSHIKQKYKGTCFSHHFE